MKYLKCVNGSVEGTDVGDIRKVWWSEDDQLWYMEDPEEPGIPWVFDMEKKAIEGCDCFFEEVADVITWYDSPQGEDFWDSIDYGVKPEVYYVTSSQVKTKDTPALGDVLHYNGEQVVYLSNLHSGCHLVSFENGVTLEVTLDELDEYKPNETQELRNRILERWKRKSINNAWDTLICRVDMSISDLIDFVVDNLNAEYSGD